MNRLSVSMSSEPSISRQIRVARLRFRDRQFANPQASDNRRSTTNAGAAMVIAHHLMWTAYGYWLPNDPRGSMSRVIRNESVGQLGPRHYGRKAQQPPFSETRKFRQQSQSVLMHKLLHNL